VIFRRSWAALIAVGIPFVILMPVGLATTSEQVVRGPSGATASVSQMSTAGGLVFYGLALLYWLSIIVFQRGITGRTLGMRMQGLACVGQDGLPPGPRAAAWRSVAGLIDYIGMMFCVPIVGLLTISRSRRHQRVGDMAAHTFVIDFRALGHPVDPLPPTPPGPTEPAI